MPIKKHIKYSLLLLFTYLWAGFVCPSFPQPSPTTQPITPTKNIVPLSFSSQRIYISQINPNDLSTANLFVQDDRFQDILNHNTGFSDLNVVGIIELGYDHEKNEALSSQLINTVDIDVLWRDSLGTNLAFKKSLGTSFNQLSSDTTHDKVLLNWKDAREINASIKKLSDQNGDSVAFSSAAKGLYIEARLEIQRAAFFDIYTTPVLAAAIDPVKEIASLKWQPIPGASFYELEWVYIDDYSDSTVSIPSSEIKYTFRHRAMRVRTPANYYELPMVFKSGYVVFRVRAVAETINKNFSVLYGPWSLNENYDPVKRRGIKTISALLPSQYIHISGSAIHEEKKNWFFKTTFDEEGKSQSQITYYDGMQKPVQQVTHIAGEEVAIVTETFFDHAGRPSVTTLPAPVKENVFIKYYEKFNRNSSGTAKYSFPDFEGTSACGLSLPDSMHPSSGAAKYYSPSNPFQNGNQPWHKYVPDAKGRPFTLSRFLPDNTGRIMASGMAGTELQTGGPHQTRYMYGTPAQEELDRLFGTDAGNETFYRKNIITDPNGQMQVEYKNVKGEIIASALTAPSPSNLIALTSENDTTPLWKSGTIINAKYINTYSNPKASAGNDTMSNLMGLSFNKTILSTGGNFTFSYETEGENWSSSCDTSICFDCIYHLQLKLKDLCGNEYFSSLPSGITDTIGFLDTSDSLSMVGCDSKKAKKGYSIDTLLPAGSYTLEKILQLDADAIEEYFQAYLKTDTCLKTLQDFVDSNLAALDTSVCELDCENCTDSLAPDTSSLGVLNDSLCTAECTDAGNDWCSGNFLTLLSDMSPGGQYALYNTQTDAQGQDICWNQKDQLSIFRPGGSLPVDQEALMAYPDIELRMRYTAPLLYQNGSFIKGYFTQDGQRDTIWLDCQWKSTSPCKDIVRDTNDIKTDPLNQKFYIFPEDLNICEFINRFKGEWAKSLVVYHPEFAYIRWCNKVYNDTNTIAGLTINSFQYDSYLLNIPRDSAVMQNVNLVNPMAHDPFFKPGALGTKTVYQNFTIPFWWDANDPNCIKPWYNPQQLMNLKMNAFADTLNIWEAAFLSYHQCDTVTIPINMADLIPDDSTWQLLVTMYIGQKRDMMQRMAHAFADSMKRLNTCIGDKNYYLHKSWLSPSLMSCASFFSLYNAQFPGYNNKNICSSWHNFLYRNKTKRFGTAQELVGLPDNATGDSLLDLLENNSDAAYFELTGNCPLAGHLLLMLETMSKEKALLANHTLSTCNFASEKIMELFADSTPEWKPVLNSSGKILTANIISGTDSCLVKLTIPSGNNFTWNDSIAGIEKISVTGSANGLVSFSLLVNFVDTSSHHVYVTGLTCIPIDTCSFSPTCVLKPIADELPSVLNLLMEKGWMPADTLFMNEMPQSFISLLDSGSYYLWNRSSGKIINPAMGKSIKILTTPPLNGLAQPGIFTGTQAMDTSKAEGCKNMFALTYLNNSGNIQLSGNILYLDSFPVPVECCTLPTLCGEQNGLEALKSMISQAMPFIFTSGKTTELMINPETDNLFTGIPPLYYQTFSVDDTAGILSGMFFTGAKAKAITSQFIRIDTLCLLNISSEDLPLTPPWDTSGNASCTLLDIIPIMGSSQGDGYTYEFFMVYKVSAPGKKPVIDTLWGESCIPLKPCFICEGGIPVAPVNDNTDNSKFRKNSKNKQKSVPQLLSSASRIPSPVNTSSDGCFNITIPDTVAINFYDPCQMELLSIALLNAQNDYKNYEDSLRKAFYRSYKMKCLGAKEKLQATYTLSEYHYTLYYYDQAGNLVRTVPPKGVHYFTDTNDINLVQQKRAAKQTFVPPHTMSSNYRFNSLNNERKRETPDAGIAETWYDELGRIVLSQNANQSPLTSGGFGRYSYTVYDKIGRAIETGEASTTGIPANIILSPGVIKYDKFLLWIAGSVRKQVTKTHYDISAFNPPDFVQENLRGRVSSSAIDDDGDNNYEFATHYSYDIHGNVKSLLNENASLPLSGGAACPVPKVGGVGFRIDYDYDLLSGKVKKVAYQPGQPDAFYHYYSYDAGNRLKEVFTSFLPTSGFRLPTGGCPRDATYYYYHHGPLARIELGERQVQGLDYAYTINGWIKGVNSETLLAQRDIGQDGNISPTSGGAGVGNPNRFFARDVFGYGIHYYENDYASATNFTQQNYFLSSGFPPSGGQGGLFNGNIAGSITALTDTMEVLANIYRYDQLNRLKEGRVWTGLDKLQNSWGNAVSTDNYYNSFTYDANGNILNLLRNAINTNGNPLSMDSLKYHYYPGNNQLRQVRDAIPDGNYSEDIDDQPDTSNYQYDNIGNLVKDKSEEIDTILWNVYGKVSEIKRVANSTRPDLKFHYSADGQRISKEVFYPGGKAESTFYSRDARGNIMAIYTSANDTFRLEEQIIYGSSRLGVIRRDKVLTAKKTFAPLKPFMSKEKTITPLGENSDNPLFKNAPSVPVIPPFPTPPNKFEISLHTLGMKRYELSNWLGNVNVVISDKKFGVDTNSDGWADWYRADVRSVVDYYAGGMEIPNRNYSTSEYKFGYQGQIKTDEVYGSGNLYSYEFREQDPRLVRFWSVDPNSNLRLEWSVYNSMRCNPIINIDPDGGLDTKFEDEKGNEIANVKDGSNAVFQIKEEGNDMHYEFKEWDMSQVGKKEINVTSVIQEQQKFNMKNPDLEQESNGQTWCNRATLNVIKATESAYREMSGLADLKISLPIVNANTMADKLAESKYFKAVDKEKAFEKAKNGQLVVLAWKNPTAGRSGHLATLSVGENREIGEIANIGPKAYTGFVKLNASYSKDKQEKIKYYIIDIKK